MISDKTLRKTARFVRPIGRLACLALIASTDPVAVTIGSVNLAIQEWTWRT